jgi:hypothetical protein
MEANGYGTGERRVAHQDTVGNFLEAVKGTDANVFIDDRYDMYPIEVIDDYESLLSGSPDWQQVLDEREIDTVLWGRTQPLAELVEASPDWQVVYGDQDWIVACRRGTCV